MEYERETRQPTYFTQIVFTTISFRNETKSVEWCDKEIMNRLNARHTESKNQTRGNERLSEKISTTVLHIPFK